MISKISNVQLGQTKYQKQLSSNKSNMTFKGVEYWVLKPSTVTLIPGLDHSLVHVHAPNAEGKAVINHITEEILNGFFKIFRPKGNNGVYSKSLHRDIINFSAKDGRKLYFTDETASLDGQDKIQIISRDRILGKKKKKSKPNIQADNNIPKLDITQNVKAEIEKVNTLHDEIIITRDDYNATEFDALKKAIIQTNTNLQIDLSGKLLKQVVEGKFKFKSLESDLPATKTNDSINIFESKDGRKLILDKKSVILVSKKGRQIKFSVNEKGDETLNANVIQLIENLKGRLVPPSEKIPA